MKAMKASVKYLSMVGIYSQGLSDQTIEYWKAFRVCIVLAIYVGPFLCGSLIFILRHPNDFERTINAYMIISGASAALGGFLSFWIDGMKIRRLIDEYQFLIDTGDEFI